MPALRPRRPLPAGPLLLLGLLLAAPAARAQAAAPVYGAGGGPELFLTDSGFGVGAGLARPLGGGLSVLAEASVVGAEDEREAKFFGVGGPAIQSKANFLALVGARGGLSQRLFAGAIEDNVRPFVAATLGPTLGWAYPYFADCNGDRRFQRRTDCDGDGTVAAGEGERTLGFFEALPRGSARLGVGGLVAVGAHLGFSARRGQVLRVGYRFDYLPAGVQLLEPDVREPQHFFGTPTISLTVWRGW